MGEDWYSGADDAELIAAYGKNGDEQAFETLYFRHRMPLYGFLNHLTGNVSEADEVFELAWLKVIRKLPEYRHQGKFNAWLFRVARNIFYDRLRAGKEYVPVQELPETADTVTPAEELENAELGAVIDKAVERLTPEQREVFLLRQQGVPFKEIAEIQGCPLNTALARMQYALKRLRANIAESDNGELL